MDLIHRNDLVQAQRQNPQSARRDGAVRAGITGSGESLLVLSWTADELAQERAAGVRLLTAAGVSPGMRVANTLPGALATPGSLQLGDVVDQLGALDIPLGTVDNDAAAKQAWELVDRVQANVLVLDPRSGERFLNAAPKTQRPWWSGIVWTQTDAAVTPAPSVPECCGFAGRQRSWLAIPEVTSFVAMSCRCERFHPDESLHIEVVEPESGKAEPAGRPGVLALKPSSAARLYRSVFRARALAECMCGKSGIALESVA